MAQALSPNNIAVSRKAMWKSRSAGDSLYKAASASDSVGAALSHKNYFPIALHHSSAIKCVFVSQERRQSKQFGILKNKLN